MAGIKGKDTKPELIVRRAAHHLGLRFRLHAPLPGRPDLVFPKWKVVVFVNGCFWHRHPGCSRTTFPKSNADFWRLKFQENTRRDAANYSRLRATGWRVVVIWQCEARTIEMATAALKTAFPLG